jgi:hypothetical protein
MSCDAMKADDGSRTRDLRLGKPTLYQLSYVRKCPAMLVDPSVSHRAFERPLTALRFVLGPSCGAATHRSCVLAQHPPVTPLGAARLTAEPTSD